MHTYTICPILAGSFQNFSFMPMLRCWCLPRQWHRRPAWLLSRWWLRWKSSQPIRWRCLCQFLTPPAWRHNSGNNLAWTWWSPLRMRLHWAYGIYIYTIYIYIHTHHYTHTHTHVVYVYNWWSEIARYGKGVSFSLCYYVYCRDLKLSRELVDILDVLENRTWHKRAEGKVLLCWWRLCKDWYG